MKKEFEKFVKGKFGLEIRSKNKLIYRSKKENIFGLLEFIKKYGRRSRNLIIFDRKVGNAVALLCAYLKVKEVYGATGSNPAKKTLKKFKIKFHFSKTIPNILNKDETDICPMEKMLLGNTPAEFLDLLKTKGVC